MEPSRVQVLDRALDLIEQLAATESGMSIAELAQRTGLPKSTIHRILLTFSERNYIEKDPSPVSIPWGRNLWRSPASISTTSASRPRHSR